MLIEFLEEFLANRKKYFGAIWGFIFGVILIKYGFIDMLKVLSLTIVGYNLGDTSKIKALKKALAKRLND